MVEASPGARLRVVQWTTGNVGRQTVRAVLARPDLELVGVFAHAADKAGRDVAELCGLTAPTGILATNDPETLLALAPDCVVYTPLHFDPDEVGRMLGAGVNVVTSSEFLDGHAHGGEVRTAIETAAVAGGASIFGSGMNPGFAQLLAAVAAGISTGVRKVTVTESVDVSLFAGDPNSDALGWGRPAGDPGHADEIRAATSVFLEGINVLADLLGVELDDHRCTVDFARTTRDVEVPGLTVEAGHIGGLDVRWEGLVGGVAVVAIHQRWVIGSDLEPRWEVEHGYLVEVDGDPRVRVKLEVWPDLEDLSGLTRRGIHEIGMRITGVPVVDAIPAVCAALPGIRTYADLPVVTARLSPQASS